MDIPFRFTGLQTLRIKETDRIAALKKEMEKLGYILNDSIEGTLSWDGTRCQPDENPVIDTYDDHRMALAFAPAAIMFPGLRINNPGVVSKSYPTFWDDLRAAGFRIEEVE
jgi:3-phosphoshikimate 1-carboxyvinyltransferase